VSKILDIDSFLVEDKDVSVNGVNGLLKLSEIDGFVLISLRIHQAHQSGKNCNLEGKHFFVGLISVCGIMDVGV